MESNETEDKDLVNGPETECGIHTHGEHSDLLSMTKTHFLMCGNVAQVGIWVGWGKPASPCSAAGQFKFVGCILAITDQYVVIFVMPATAQSDGYMEYDISRAFVQSYFVGELSHVVMVPSPVDSVVSPSGRHEETAEVFREWCDQNVRMDGAEVQS